MLGGSLSTIPADLLRVKYRVREASERYQYAIDGIERAGGTLPQYPMFLYVLLEEMRQGDLQSRRLRRLLQAAEHHSKGGICLIRPN